MSIRIMYLRAPNGHPVGCVAMSYDSANRVVSYQASFLNPKDKFDRHVARNIALGRLATKANQAEMARYSHHFSGDGNITTHDITKVVMIEISSMMDGVPSRAVKAAKLWLNQLHPELQNASLEKVCEMANQLVNSFDGRIAQPIDQGQLAFDLSYMLEYLRLNFNLVPKE